MLFFSLSFVFLCTITRALGSDIQELEEQVAELKNRVSQLEANQITEEPNEDTSETDPTSFQVFWKEGLNFATQDGHFTLKAGGRIHNDWLWISEDSDLKTNVGEQEDGVEFRRARLCISGLLYGNVEFEAEYDFAGGDTEFKDIYLGFLDGPLGNIRAGHFKEPFSLEELTSSNYITFLERALPNAFAPGRNAGVMLYGTALARSDPRLTWAVGVFRDTPDDGAIRDDGGYNVTGRLTLLPWYENDGTSLAHLGAGFSYRNPNDHTASFNSNPEAHLTDNFVDTGAFQSDDVSLVGLEAACVSGPLSIQGEYIFADADVASSANFQGYYAQVSYFLTGEHRIYKPTEGNFCKIKSRKNFHYGTGPGAWEVAFRYSGIDLDDSIISGGKLHDMTAGLNWYLNPNMRIMWNYVHADKEYVGYADILTMRLQVNF